MRNRDANLEPYSRIIIWGGIIFAPAVTGWFNLLNKVPIQSKWPSALVKTGLDQFAFAPIALSGMSLPSLPSLISLISLISLSSRSSSYLYLYPFFSIHIFPPFTHSPIHPCFSWLDSLSCPIFPTVRLTLERERQDLPRFSHVTPIRT